MRKNQPGREKMKQKVISKIKKRMSEEMAERTKWRAIENDIWGGNEHIKESNSGTFKNIIKIRLHI